MKKNDGGPAFPRSGDSFHSAVEGMSLRDWFAGQVLTGLMATAAEMTHASRKPDVIATDCYKIADAMIAEREK